MKTAIWDSEGPTEWNEQWQQSMANSFIVSVQPDNHAVVLASDRTQTVAFIGENSKENFVKFSNWMRNDNYDEDIDDYVISPLVIADCLKACFLTGDQS